MKFNIKNIKLNESSGLSSEGFDENTSVEICPFLVENNRNTFFLLTCNYLSLGQFELARSTIYQLYSVNFKFVSELISSIINYGFPPDWQLSPSIPTSAHLILACFKEFQFLSNILSDKKNQSLKKVEFDLLIGDIILDNSNGTLNYNAIKEMRKNYYFLYMCTSKEIFSKIIFIPELKLLPNIAGIPPYLSRISSYLSDINSFLKDLIVDNVKNNFFSEDVISELIKYSISFPRIFCFLAKFLIIENNHLNYFEKNNCEENNLKMRVYIKNMNISMQWIIIKSCYKCINFFLFNDDVSVELLMDNILNYFKIVKLEDIFDNYDLNKMENKILQENNLLNNSELSSENAISFIVSIFCFLNFFCKYGLNRKFIESFFIDKIQILKDYEEICYINANNPKIIRDINILKSNIHVIKKKYFYNDIWFYLKQCEFNNISNNYLKPDYIGELINSKLKFASIFEIVLYYENVLFYTHFKFKIPLEIFFLPKYKKEKIKNPFFNYFSENEFLYYFCLEDNQPIFWSEYLKYLDNSKYQYEEIPFLLVSDILKGNKSFEYRSESLELIKQINTCFPQFRSLNIFLGLRNDLIFDWNLIENLWLPYRLSNMENFTEENKFLTIKLDEICRKLAISILILKNSSIEFSNEKNALNQKVKDVFNEISKKKSIIQYYFDNFNHKDTKIKWSFLEEFIKQIITLPLSSGNDLMQLIEDRDCLKYYLLFEDIIKITKMSFDESIGLLMQNISIEIGRIKSYEFHNEFIYCFYCKIFAYLKEKDSFLLDFSLNFQNDSLKITTYLIYYLYIWSKRLSNNGDIKMEIIVNKTFERVLLLIEFVLFSFPFEIFEDNVFNGNITIFMWWYNFILKVPEKAFKLGKSLICSKNINYFKKLNKKRWILRKIYKSSPWFSCILNFETQVCLEDNVNTSSSKLNINAIFTSSALVMKLLQIQSYDNIISLISESNYIDKDLVSVTLDNIIFYGLVEGNFDYDLNFISNLINILISKLNKEYLFKFESKNNFSTLEILKSIISYLSNKFSYMENEIGWLFKFLPQLYLAYIIVDFCIRIGQKNAFILELTKNIKDIFTEYLSFLDQSFIKAIYTVLNKLNLFLESNNSVSLARYIMEIDALPRKSSQLKTHLGRIQNRKTMTTTLTQSLNYLINSSEKFSILNDDLIDIKQILIQSLNSLENYENSRYLFLVLSYIHKIINLLFQDFEGIKIPPLLTLTPNEIISCSFFNNKTLLKISELSKIMDIDIISVITKILNNCFSNLPTFFKHSDLYYKDLENLFSEKFFSLKLLPLIVYNILPLKNVEYNYITWNFTFEKLEKNPFFQEKIMKHLLYYRIWKLNILKLINACSKKFDILKKISDFFFMISSKYSVDLHRWLNLFQLAFYFDENEFEKLYKILNNGIDTYFYNFAPIESLIKKIGVQIIDHSIKKIVRNGRNFKSISLKNMKILINSMDPFSIPDFFIKFQYNWDLNVFFSTIDISIKRLEIFLSFFSNSITDKKLIEKNIIFLTIQRWFLTSILNSLNENINLWKKWNLMIKGWTSVSGVVILINFLLKLELFDIAKFTCNKLLNIILEENKEEIIKNNLNELISNNEIIEEIKSISWTDHSKFITNINDTISIMQNNFKIKKWNLNIFNDLVFLKRSQDFCNSIFIFNNITNIKEKYLFIDTLLAFHSSILDLNRINVLKTISVSLKLIEELKFLEIDVFIYSPYLILRKAIIEKNKKVIHLLKKEMDVFLKSDGILLNLIEESFGVLDEKLDLITKIKSSSIFGQADFKNCCELFPVIKKTETHLKIQKAAEPINLDISFSIELLSLLPKKNNINNFIFDILDKLSNQLYFLTQKIIISNSLLRIDFEKENFIWIFEEGSLKNVSSNLHPFSKFKSARKFSNYVENNKINVYKKRKVNFIENSLIYDSFSTENTKNTIFISKLRVKIKSLNQLLFWASKNIESSEFYLAIKCMPFLYQLWYKIPEKIITLKDIVFFKEEVIKTLILVDQLELTENILNLSNYENSNITEKENLSQNCLKIENIILNSKTLSTINFYYNKIKYNYKDIHLINNSKSKNDIILEIFHKKWKLKRTKNIYLNNINNGSMPLIEQFILTKNTILNSNILKILLVSISWNILLQSRTNLNSTLPIPFELKKLFFEKLALSQILEVYKNLLFSNEIIEKKHINVNFITFSQFLKFYNRSEITEDDFQSSNESLNITHVIFSLEKILNVFKQKLFTKDIQKNKVSNFFQSAKDNFSKSKSLELILNQNLYSFYKYEFLNQILLQNEQNHILIINYLVKLNFWWEVMIYIFRWGFEIGPIKPRSLSLNEKRDLSTNSNDEKFSFDDLFHDLVVKKAHSKNQLNYLIDAINEALPFGGPKASIVVRRCKQTIQKYLESRGALEILYISFFSNSLINDMPHALAGVITVHLSLINHINIDTRTGYLESALHHFSIANWSLRRRAKVGLNKKQSKSLYSNSNFQSCEQKICENSPTAQNIIETTSKLKNILITSIADVPVHKINNSPWGGLSQFSLERIISLVELQTQVIQHLLKENACFSLLNPNYTFRRDTILKLFFQKEYSLAFKSSEMLNIPLLEVLVLATKELIKCYSTNTFLLEFLDSMKYWLSTEDSDALISNSVNMWISEKKINLNNLKDSEKKSIIELINKLTDPLSKNEAYNVIHSKTNTNN